MSNVLLIVDDSRVSRMILSKVFQSLVSDWTIIEAQNGQEAITLASEHQPSLVIMDLNMPVLNGLEAALIMKPQMTTSTIIILTADIQASNKARINDLGIHFIEKPITEAVVQQALSCWRAEHA
jgi:CheY-like chemotaxis protein